jgi:hypothetical protein
MIHLIESIGASPQQVEDEVLELLATVRLYVLYGECYRVSLVGKITTRPLNRNAAVENVPVELPASILLLSDDNVLARVEGFAVCVVERVF